MKIYIINVIVLLKNSNYPFFEFQPWTIFFCGHQIDEVFHISRVLLILTLNWVEFSIKRILFTVQRVTDVKYWCINVFQIDTFFHLNFLWYNRYMFWFSIFFHENLTSYSIFVCLSSTILHHHRSEEPSTVFVALWFPSNPTYCALCFSYFRYWRIAGFFQFVSCIAVLIFRLFLFCRNLFNRFFWRFLHLFHV